MILKERFIKFLSDESGHAEHRHLIRFGGIVAVGTTLAALMIGSQSEAAGVACGSAGKCYSPDQCCSFSSSGGTSYWCSVTC